MSSKSNAPSYQRNYNNNGGKNNKPVKNKKKNNNSLILIIVGIVLVVAIVLIVVFTTGGGNATGKQNANGDLVIAKSDITTKLKIYTVKVDNVKIEVLAAKTSNGSLRIAFNTCQACYDSGKGYFKVSGNTATCQNCGNRYTVDQFPTSPSHNGCDPWAIASSSRQDTDSDVIIPISFLRANKNLFNYR